MKAEAEAESGVEVDEDEYCECEAVKEWRLCVERNGIMLNDIEDESGKGREELASERAVDVRGVERRWLGTASLDGASGMVA